MLKITARNSLYQSAWFRACFLSFSFFEIIKLLIYYALQIFFIWVSIYLLHNKKRYCRFRLSVWFIVRGRFALPTKRVHIKPVESFDCRTATEDGQIKIPYLCHYSNKPLSYQQRGIHLGVNYKDNTIQNTRTIHGNYLGGLGKADAQINHSFWWQAQRKLLITVGPLHLRKVSKALAYLVLCNR